MYVFKVLFWGLLLTLPLHTYAQDELKNPREVIASIPISGNTVDITGHKSFKCLWRRIHVGSI